MAEFHPPEGLLTTVTKIVSEKWGPCEDDVCEADRSGLGTDCTAVRGTVADVLAALFEACEVRESFVMTYMTRVAKLERSVFYEHREDAVASARSYATEGYLPAEVEHLWRLTYMHPVMRIYDDAEPVSSTGEEPTGG